MKLGIMQPYFFPYLGHFALISACDQWLVFDISQYTKKSWMNRNRLLHPDKGWSYISAPVANASLDKRIHEITLQDIISLHKSILGRLTAYKGKAPFYRQVVELVNRVFLRAERNTLVSLNVAALVEVCAYLDIPFVYKKCSDMVWDFPAHMHAGDWALQISIQMKADTYLNPSSGQNLFEMTKFREAGIQLGFSHFSISEYETPGFAFEPGLSILDVIMWCSPTEINHMIMQGHSIEYVT